MFIRIKDGIIESWADWQFEGSSFTDLEYAAFDPENYSIDGDGNLLEII